MDNVKYKRAKKPPTDIGGILKLCWEFWLGFIARGELNIWKELNNNIFNNGDITWQQRQHHQKDLLPHLPDCDVVVGQSTTLFTLQELAEKYKPSKFWRYTHSNFYRMYPQYLEKYRNKKFRMLEIGLDPGSGRLL